MKAWMLACMSAATPLLIVVACDESATTAAQDASVDSASDVVVNDASNTDGTLGPEIDAGADVAVDGTVTDVKVDACTSFDGVQDAAGFTAVWKKPVPFNTGACTRAQIDALLCVIDPSLNSSCGALLADPDNSACLACMYTPPSATQLGPVNTEGDSAVPNTAGCIANAVGDTSATGCGAHLQAYEQCVSNACARVSGVPESCRSYECDAAPEAACSSFANAASCASPLLAPDGAAEDCRDTGFRIGDVRRLAWLFCGDGSPLDAGADAPNDG